MRIGLLIYGSLDTLSGGYLYDRKLVARLCARGDSVEIISLPWRRYPLHLLDNTMPALLRRLRTLPVDLLLQDELNHPSLFLLNTFLRPSVSYPIASIVHHLRSDEDHPPALLPLYRRVERHYLHTLDAAIYNSHTTRASVERLAARAIPHVVAWPAADHLPLPPPDQVHAHVESRARSIGPLRLLCVGSVIPRKGIHHLLEALSLLPSPYWTLTVAGRLDVDPAYVRGLGRLARRLKIEDGITLRGQLSDGALCDELRRNHALALLSFEGFGIAYLEAMGFGLPVIAPRIGAAPELIRHDQNGYLVDPTDPQMIARYIEQLHRDRTLLVEMGRAARSRFDQHPTWAESCERIRAFIRATVDRSTPAC